MKPLVTVCALVALAASRAVARDGRPWDPKRDAMRCVARDGAVAAARLRQLVGRGEVALTGRMDASCVRCLARGKNGKPIEIDPLVCDSLVSPKGDTR